MIAAYANFSSVVVASGSQFRGGFTLIDPTSLIEIWFPNVFAPFTVSSDGLQICWLTF